MTLYATERIEDAAALTRSLLVPFDLRLWARLVVVVAFLGVGSGGGSITSQLMNLPSSGASLSTVSEPDVSVSVPGSVLGVDLVTFVAAVAAGLALLWLVFGFVGATLEFLFVEALADHSLSVRSGFGRHYRRGLRLFGFRVVLFSVTALLIGGTVLALFWDPITTLLSGGTPTVNDTRLAVGVVVAGAVTLVVGLIALIIHGMTTEFVVPVMLETGCGVLAGWGQLWSTIRAQGKQYVVYLLVALGLRIATAAAAGIVIGIVTFVLAIPFVIVGAIVGLGAITSGTVSAPVVVALGVLGAVFGVLVLLVSAAVYVPVAAFHRYFALLFVGDVESTFDVLGERRPSMDETFSLF